jgi:adenylate cyclase
MHTCALLWVTRRRARMTVQVRTGRPPAAPEGAAPWRMHDLKLPVSLSALGGSPDRLAGGAAVDDGRCPSCGSGNAPEARFCVTCGEPLRSRPCPGCGAATQPSFQFCPSCGRPLQGPAAPKPEPVETRRRRATTLFADLVGFSTLAEHMDPEHLHALLDGVFGEMSEAVETEGGRVERFTGDALLATFGGHTAHEDDPRRAVDAALRMMQSVRARSVDTPAPLQLRIGINSGLVVFAPVVDGFQSELFGDAVNVTARLQQAASPGAILVAAPVWRRVRDHYEGQHVGMLEVKGREQPVDAYRILGPRARPGRRQAPFVGRREELALLDLLWSSTVKGTTHVVSVIGEAGVGKSRLLAELPPRTDAHEVRIECRSDRTPGPMAELVHRLLGGAPRDLEDLRTRCRSWPEVDQEVTALLASFLGLAGDAPAVGMADPHERRQVFAGVWLFLRAVAEERPLLIVLDDAHAADRSSLDLVDFLLERLGGSPIMLVLAYRPGFGQVERTFIRASHTVMRLELLTAAESVALAKGFLGVAELPKALEGLAASRAEGNPFFIEELLQALLEIGSLTVHDSRAVLAEGHVEIPDTVEGTILARVDRLDPRARTVLHHAAVIGRSFSTSLLRSMASEDGLEDVLEGLGRTQLVLAEGPDQWAFKHALIQEVTYSTLLLRQRQELHRIVAEALEATDPGQLDVLAEHYAKAGIRDKARRYAVAAGDAASERMGFVEARSRYETALALWGEGDEAGRLSLVMKLATAQVVGADPAAAATSLIEAEAGWRALGDYIRAGESLATLGRVYFWTGEAERSEDFLRRAIEMLEAQPPSQALIKALTWASALKIITGEVDEGAALASRGLSVAPEVLSDAARSSLLTTLGSCQVHLGNPNGVRNIRTALEIAQHTREAEALGRAYINLVLGLSELYDPEALETARRGREAVRKRGALSFEITIAGREAGILSALGRYHEAEDVARDVLDTRRPVMVAPGLLFAGLSLAETLLRKGAYDDAKKRLDDMLPVTQRVGGGMFVAPARAIGTELEEARGNRASARLELRDAMEVAMQTPSLVHALHCVVPAARIAGQGAGPLVQRLKDLPPHPSFASRLREADGYLGGGRGAFLEAADLYASLGLPYEEARCRLEAGQLERAAELIERFGLQDGPLGARLRDLSGS